MSRVLTEFRVVECNQRGREQDCTTAQHNTNTQIQIKLTIISSKIAHVAVVVRTDVPGADVVDDHDQHHHYSPNYYYYLGVHGEKEYGQTK